MNRKILPLAGALTAALLLASTACSSSGGGGDTTGGKVELTFWTWAPNMDKVVDGLERRQPRHPGHGQQAGTAATRRSPSCSPPPRPAAAPRTWCRPSTRRCPTLVSSRRARRHREPTCARPRRSSPHGVWNAVTLGTDAVYAIPQDTGPMMFYYRADVFTAARPPGPHHVGRVRRRRAQGAHRRTRRSTSATFSANDPGWFAGLSQQAGAKWWGVNGDAWKVGINDAATKKVADYWGGLVAGGRHRQHSRCTRPSGTRRSTTARWSPGSAPSGGRACCPATPPTTKGKWKIAPLPQWTAGE